MKANFKPLSLAAAVATATVGYAGISNAQIVPVGNTASVASNGLGDLAIIPYYTTKEDWGTGIHIINTSKDTQVIKLRFRRAMDSLDSMDLNLILSPEDEWTGFLNDDANGQISLTTQDTSCTAPLFDGKFDMPDIYSAGADEGYIEVIGMGATTSETFALAKDAKHKDGVPKNCQFAEDMFLDFYFNPDSLTEPTGVADNTTVWGFRDSEDDEDEKVYESSTLGDTGNVLKVSWFIRDGGTGIEFGNDAVHIADFADQAMMTNQEFGIFTGNTRGFDFPDLDGGSPNGGGQDANGDPTASFNPNRGLYNTLRDVGVLGTKSIINDWSDNPDLLVGTDWIITIPGQYVMLDIPEYLNSLADEDIICDIAVGDACDNRDIPVTAAFSIWDREEDNLTINSDRDVVISPSIPGVVPTTQLKYEVNVLHWSPERPVIDSDYAINIDTSLLDAVSGWAKLTVKSQTVAGVSGSVQNICNWSINGGAGWDPRPGVTDPNDIVVCDGVAKGAVPMVGFVAWERSFPDNPDGNYGRAVAHSFESGS